MSIGLCLAIACPMSWHPLTSRCRSILVCLCVLYGAHSSWWDMRAILTMIMAVPPFLSSV